MSWQITVFAGCSGYKYLKNIHHLVLVDISAVTHLYGQRKVYQTLGFISFLVLMRKLSITLFGLRQ